MIPNKILCKFFLLNIWFYSSNILYFYKFEAFKPHLNIEKYEKLIFSILKDTEDFFVRIRIRIWNCIRIR